MKLSALEHEKLSLGILPDGVSEGQFVPLAAETARYFTEEEVGNPLVLHNLIASRNRLETSLSEIFAVERELITATTKELVRVKYEIMRLEKAHIGLPTLDPSFLSWKTPEGYPAFSIYSLHSPLCKIMYGQQWGARSASLTSIPLLPPILGKHYLDDNLRVGFRSEAQNLGLSRIELTAQYDGAMPESVREKILYYTRTKDPSVTFSHIFIIAEAPAWQRNTVSNIAVGDPLVVGLKHGLVWLIDKYDLAPVERVVMELCAAPVPHTNN